MSDAAITVVCGTVVALLQAYTTYRLRQQDNVRNAAREEQKLAAERIKQEALAAAKSLENKVTESDERAIAEREQIHVLVNHRMESTLARVQELEDELRTVKEQVAPNKVPVPRPRKKP